MCSMTAHAFIGISIHGRHHASRVLHVLYSLLQWFNAVVPHGERSRVMEVLMKQALIEREAELERMAEAFMTDPAFAECRDDENLWDATVADGLDRTF
jgi:hypothetical protein